MDRGRRILLDRRLSWALAFVTVAKLVSGYALTRFQIEKSLLMKAHIGLALLFSLLFIHHLYSVAFALRYPWFKALGKLVKGKADQLTLVRLIQGVSGIILLFSASLMVLTGLLWLGYSSPFYVPFRTHLDIDYIFNLALVVHLGSSLKSVSMRRGWGIDKAVTALTVVALGALAYIEQSML